MAVNLSELLADAARVAPDDVALVEVAGPSGPGARREMSWGELDASATAFARALSGRGLVAGARVACVMVNRADLPVAYFGVLRGGMVAVPVNPRSTSTEVGRVLVDSGARFVLCDAAGVQPVRRAVAELGLELQVVVDGVEPSALAAGEVTFADVLESATTGQPAAPRDPDTLAVVLYTSGTSGRPRGAMLTHRALLANIEQVARVEPPPVTADDVLLGLLPMFHVYGLNAVLGQAVRQRARVVLVERFDADGLLDVVRDEGVSYLPLAPPVVAAWAGRDDLRAALSGVRTVVSGASALDADLAAEFARTSGHAIEQGYGFTEASPIITATVATPREVGAAPTPGSVGSPLPGIDLRLVAAHGEVETSGDPAELWVRGENLFSGYWPDRQDGPDADGWYPTGDVGYLTSRGELVLVDRVRELVIVSGFNVYPSEVEEVVASVEGVEQVAVVGLPDERTGESVLAFVVPAEGVDAAALEAAVVDACARTLARFKRPSRVAVVRDLPRSATGKIEKGRLRALARRDVLGLGPS